MESLFQPVVESFVSEDDADIQEAARAERKALLDRARTLLHCGQTVSKVAAEPGLHISQLVRLSKKIQRVEQRTYCVEEDGEILSPDGAQQLVPVTAPINTTAHAVQERSRRLAQIERVNALLQASGLPPRLDPIKPARAPRKHRRSVWDAEA